MSDSGRSADDSAFEGPTRGEGQPDELDGMIFGEIARAGEPKGEERSDRVEKRRDKSL